MDSELKAKWIESLRGGAYEQTTDQLCGIVVDEEGFGTEDVGFCCLGVLSEIMEEATRVDEYAYTFSIPQDVVARIRVENEETDIEGLTDSGDSEIQVDDDGEYYARATSMIPDFVADDLGLRKKFPTTDPQGEPTHDELRNILAKMNDGGKTFSEIADYIESLDF